LGSCAFVATRAVTGETGDGTRCSPFEFGPHDNLAAHSLFEALMNLLADRVFSQRTTARRSIGVSDPKSSVANRDLIAAAQEAAGEVRRKAASQTPMVAVAHPLSVDAIVGLTAAIVGDYSVCFLDPSVADERRRQIMDALQPDVVMDDHGIRAVGAQANPAARAHEPGYVAMSSGSTGGVPKAVLSSWNAIAAFVPFGAEALEVDQDSSWAEVSHLAYDMAITNVLVGLASGCAIHVSPALSDRLRPLRFVERVQATHLRLAPRFVDLAVNERHVTDTTTLRVWGSGGDRLLVSQARQIFGLGVPVIVNTYGTSETAGFASSARLDDGDTLTATHGSVTIGVGRVGSWSTRVVQQGDESMLAIEAPHLPSGVLFGSPTDDYPRWNGQEMVTGDLGTKVAGSLYCLGRAGRRVKRNATFVNLDQIDATIRGVQGVASFTVVSPAGELLSLVEMQVDEVDQLRGSLPALLSPDLLPDRLVPVARLPRLGNGKVDHVAARSLAEFKSDV
jgi:acyl-coenzyme A synthetase/AMP-(fatty) acid ligase